MGFSFRLEVLVVGVLHLCDGLRLGADVEVESDNAGISTTVESDKSSSEVREIKIRIFNLKI